MRRLAEWRALGAVAALVIAGSLAACGGGTSSTSSTSGSSLTGTGPITLASGKDTTGTLNSMLDGWNKLHPDQKVTLIELPESADDQRQQMIQNAQTKSDAYSILALDVVWTSEFAANGWVEQLPENQFPISQYLPPVVKTTKYFGKMYAAPYASDGGLLYYRSDLLQQAGISSPPKTWQEMTDDCNKILKTPAGAGMSCYGGQYSKYEGLTVNFSEAINSAGGQVLDSSGKPTLTGADAKKGVDFLANGFKSGLIPKDALTWKEEDGRRAFQDGKLVFHRNWPYMYQKAEATDGSSKVNGKFAVSPLPGLTGPGKSSLGGHNLAISKFAKNKKTSLDFIKWFTSQDNQRAFLQKNSQAPVYTALYDDKALQQQYPYLPTLKQSILNAEPRPAVVHYGDATAAIQQYAYAAISGTQSSDAALRDLQNKLSQIIKSK